MGKNIGVKENVILHMFHFASILRSIEDIQLYEN